MNTPQEQFDQKLRALMPQVDKVADRHSRFRHYLKDTVMPRLGLSEQELFVKAAEQFEKWRTQGVSEDYWTCCLIADFQKWWAMQIAKKRSEARKQDKSKPPQGASTPPDAESPKPRKPAPKRKAKSNTAKITLGRRK